MLSDSPAPLSHLSAVSFQYTQVSDQTLSSTPSSPSFLKVSGNSVKKPNKSLFFRAAYYEWYAVIAADGEWWALSHLPSF